MRWRRHAAITLVAGGLIAATALVAAPGPSGGALPRRPSAAMLIDRRGPHGERLLAKLDGYLTRPSQGDAAAIARSFITRRRSDLGVRATGPEALRITQRTV